MTANQIAYAGVKLGEAELEEDKRWHNIQKDLQDRAYEIDKLKAYTDKEYKEESLKLTKEWNQFQKDLETNKFEWTVDLQNRQMDLENRRYALDKWYQTTSAELKNQSNAIEMSKVQETERHNTQMEAIAHYGNVISDKQLEYQYYSLDIESGIRWKDLQLKEEANKISLMRTTNEYALGLMNIGTQQRRNNISSSIFNLDLEKWETQKKVMNSEVGNKWTNTILPFVLPTASSVLGAGINLFGGF